MSILKLEEGAQVVTAFAEPASGPGWSNTPIWVIVRGADGDLRRECIQPDEQTLEMHVLYSISNVAHSAMTAAVRHALTPVTKGASRPRAKARK